MQRGFIFPSICKFKVKNLEVDIYRDLYIKYIQKYASQELKNLITNWQSGKDQKNSEIKYLLDGSFVKVKTSFQSDFNNADMLEKFGVSLTYDKENDVFDFDLTERMIEEVKSEVYDSIFNNMYRDEINMILADCFGQNERNIGVYRSAADEREHAIDKACRAALKFTQFDYLYNESSKGSFEDFFIDNFSKRINIVKLVTEKSMSNNEIKYIPVYDHFSNYDSNNLVDIKNKLETIVGDVNLKKDDKIDILDSLTAQIYDIDDLNNPTNKKIIDEIFKPLIASKLEFDRCKNLIDTAENLYILDTDYNSVVDRAFYASMFAVRALLSHFGLLEDWNVGTMSPNEKHYTIERKLVKFMNIQSTVYGDFANDFLKLKEQRWISDYSLLKTQKSTAENCLNISKKLCSEAGKLFN